VVLISDSRYISTEYKELIGLIEPNSTVLDLGCGAGILLKELISKKNVRGRGIDIEESQVIKSIQNRIPVSQGDIDQGLREYSDKSYDYVVLSRTLQVLHRPKYVIEEMLRVGRIVIVMFPNFAYWKVRTQLFVFGRMPKTNLLPYEWYNTPNIHLLTIQDFRTFCNEIGITILKEILFTRSKRIGKLRQVASNLLAEEGLFVLTQ